MLRYLFPVPLCANSRYSMSVCLFLIITNVKHEHGDYVDFLYEFFFVLVSHFFPLLTLVRAADVFQTCLLFSTSLKCWVHFLFTKFMRCEVWVWKQFREERLYQKPWWSSKASNCFLSSMQSFKCLVPCGY